MTSNTNHLSNRLPSIPAAVQLAANEGAFALVPEFCLTAPELRMAVDSMADSAMAGLENITQITQVIAKLPAEMRLLLAEIQQLLNDQRTHFSFIGHTGDSTSDDIGNDIDVVWGLTQ